MPEIEGEYILKLKGQKDKQWPTNITLETKDLVTLTPLKTMGEPRCSGRASISSTRHTIHGKNHIRS